MNKESCICSECGHKIVTYRFNFNKGLAACIIKLSCFKEAFTQEGVSVGSIGLSPAQYTNFQKLRYWLLIEKVHNGDHNKGGWWRLTDLGIAFILGEVSIPDKVLMRKNILVKYEGKMVTIRDIVADYEYRGDYAVQKSLAGRMQLRMPDLPQI